MSRAIELKPSECDVIVRLGQALSSTLDLRVALDRFVPLLRELVQLDHVALAVSRPGTLYDYEWFNTSLPEQFLGNYAAIAQHDFVLNAVAPRPNEVLRDHQMITRKQLERHVLYRHARETGANLEQVMAVMLKHGREWSSGLSLYRSHPTPFTDHEAGLLQLIVPQITNAVCNSRRYSELQRDAWLEVAIEGIGIAAALVRPAGCELMRTANLSALLEQWFASDERKGGALPGVLIEHLHAFHASEPPNKTPAEWTRRDPLSCLHVAYVPLPERGLWALVFRISGLARELQARLSPRLLEIAGCLLNGMSNEEIAAHYDRSLATIKQQASEIYDRIGVDGRKGLIRMAWGHDS